MENNIKFEQTTNNVIRILQYDYPIGKIKHDFNGVWGLYYIDEFINSLELRTILNKIEALNHE